MVPYPLDYAIFSVGDQLIFKYLLRLTAVEKFLAIGIHGNINGLILGYQVYIYAFPHLAERYMYLILVIRDVLYDKTRSLRVWIRQPGISGLKYMYLVLIGLQYSTTEVCDVKFVLHCYTVLTFRICINTNNLFIRHSTKTYIKIDFPLFPIRNNSTNRSRPIFSYMAHYHTKI